MNKPVIIVVEDDLDLGAAILDILELGLDVDVNVELIEDGLKAKERFQAITPKLVLLDLHLPKVSGIELLQGNIGAWRSSEVKVIVMTADLMLLPPLQDLVDVCLAKPFGVEKFVQTIRQLLDNSPQPAPG